MDEQKLKESMLEDDEVEIDLVALFFNFFKILKEYWGLFVGVVIIVTVSFSLFQYFTYKPVYRCETTFTVATGDEDDKSGMTSYSYYYSSNTADQLSKTFPYILQSNYFKSVLLNELNTNTLNGTLNASTVTDSNIVTMSVESSSPEEALSILVTAVDIYPEVASFVLGDIQFHTVNGAQLPSAPYNQLTIWKTVGLGLALGIVCGLIILAMMSLFRKTVKNPEQMDRITSLKCLATIPKVKYKARHQQKARYISVMDHRTPYGFKEGMRSLQIRLERLFKREIHKIILVTSSASGEGKTTISANLAETLAMQGKKVLLIDGDLRKPSLANLYQNTSKTDLKDMFENDRHDFYQISDYLYFIGGKEAKSKPIDILSDQRLGTYLTKLKEEFDYIVIDTPPLGIFQDARILQEYSDALLYVVKHDYMPSQKIQEGLSLLKDDRCIMGYIFNVYSQFTPDYGYGRYGYGYSRYGYGHYGYGYKDKE